MEVRIVNDEPITKTMKIMRPAIILHYLLSHGPGFDSASNRNKYQEYFLGVKAAGA
jgi:hypothetical protein